MKKFNYIIGVLAFFITSQSSAALVSVQASADMTSGLSNSTTLLPIGTTVTSDVQFNIGPGTISASDFTNVTGTFNWIDSTFGAQTFNADSARIVTTHSAGWFSLFFTGTGPTLYGVTATTFGIVFDIGTNPFLPPGSTSELYDLVLNSTVSSMGVGATVGASTDFGTLETNVSGTISAVPVPAAVWLFGSGLFGLIGIARRKKS